MDVLLDLRALARLQPRAGRHLGKFPTEAASIGRHGPLRQGGKGIPLIDHDQFVGAGSCRARPVTSGSHTACSWEGQAGTAEPAPTDHIRLPFALWPRHITHEIVAQFQWSVTGIAPTRPNPSIKEEKVAYLPYTRRQRVPEGNSAMSMSGSFDRFTERARKVLTLAQEEAQRFNHNYIGTEHLLLGLGRQGDSVAAKVLSNLGVELREVRSRVKLIIGRGDREVEGEIGLNPRAKKVIELAVDEARRLGHHYIGTEHLLLGLIREGNGIAAGVLESLGVNLERVRSEVIKVLTQSGSSPPVDHPGGSTISRTPQWQYLTVQTIWSSGVARVRSVNGHEDPRFTMQHTPIYDALRELGEEGWELVGIERATEGVSGAGALYIFKRLR